MWIFAPDAVASVVQLRGDPDKLLVRTRTKGDAENIAADLGSTVTHKKHADYHWQVVVGREEFADWVWEWLMSIEYTTNVKGNIDQGDDHRHNVLMDVWSALRKLQHPPAKKKGSYPAPGGFYKHSWS